MTCTIFDDTFPGPYHAVEANGWAVIADGDALPVALFSSPEAAKHCAGACNRVTALLRAEVERLKGERDALCGTLRALSVDAEDVARVAGVDLAEARTWRSFAKRCRAALAAPATETEGRP